MDEKLNKIPSKICLWGAIGQAKGIREVIGHYGSEIITVFEENPDLPSPFPNVPIYYGWDQFLDWIKGQDKSDMGFCIGITNGKVRLELHEKLTKMDLKPATIAHPSAVIAKDAIIGEGSQIMAGAIIGPEAKIGRQCIINANASIDHDNILEDGVEIAPGATLCGLVRVGKCAWVGAGATVLPMVKIGQGALVGAGSVVNKDVPEGTTVVGIPAKPIKKK